MKPSRCRARRQLADLPPNLPSHSHKLVAERRVGIQWRPRRAGFEGHLGRVTELVSDHLAIDRDAESR